MVLDTFDIDEFGDSLVDSLPTSSKDLDIPDLNENTFNRLIRAWLNERAAPDLLPYQLDVLQDLREQLDNQEMDLDERVEGTSDAFVKYLYQQEIERIRFVMRSYLRTRMGKIEKYAAFILNDDQQRFNLSPEELEYARKYTALLERYFQKSFLEKLPEPLQALDEHEMIEKPDLEHATFCRVLNYTGRLSLRNGDVIDMEPGHVYIIRYNDIRQLLEMGDIELL